MTQWVNIIDIVAFIINGASSLMSTSLKAHHLWHFIIDGSSCWWVFLIVGSAPMVLYHWWGIIIINGASCLMSTSLMTLHHQRCFIINGSSSMALHHQWLIIYGTSSSMAHHLWNFIIDGASSSMGHYHQWDFLIEGGSSLVANHGFVLTFIYLSALNPRLQLQQQNCTNQEFPSSKMMSLATIIFRWHSQNNCICPCFWRSKIFEKIGQSKTKILLQNY